MIYISTGSSYRAGRHFVQADDTVMSDDMIFRYETYRRGKTCNISERLLCETIEEHSVMKQLLPTGDGRPSTKHRAAFYEATFGDAFLRGYGTTAGKLGI